MTYPKINSLWKREGWYFEEGRKKGHRPEDQVNRQSFIVGDYADPAFATIKYWRVEEKIDGTNIRINYAPGPDIWERSFQHGDKPIWFEGRTNKAVIQPPLLKFLEEHFTEELMQSVFPEAKRLVLYGEGYGGNIQSPYGGLYNPEFRFCLFDVYANGWWLKREDVYELAEKLGVPHPPDFGIFTEEMVIDFVKIKHASKFSICPMMMEGVVCRSEPLLLQRNHDPVMFKLKCKEFM